MNASNTANSLDPLTTYLWQRYLTKLKQSNIYCNVGGEIQALWDMGYETYGTFPPGPNRDNFEMASPPPRGELVDEVYYDAVDIDGVAYKAVEQLYRA